MGGERKRRRERLSTVHSCDKTFALPQTRYTTHPPSPHPSKCLGVQVLQVSYRWDGRGLCDYPGDKGQRCQLKYHFSVFAQETVAGRVNVDRGIHTHTHVGDCGTWQRQQCISMGVVVGYFVKNWTSGEEKGEWMDRQTDEQTDRQTDRQMDG